MSGICFIGARQDYIIRQNCVLSTSDSTYCCTFLGSAVWLSVVCHNRDPVCTIWRILYSDAIWQVHDGDTSPPPIKRRELGAKPQLKHCKL